MRKLLTAIASLSVLFATTPARALDPPHDASNGLTCSTCHTVHLTLGSAGYNNVCLTCHRPGMPKGGSYPFMPGDAADPFRRMTSAGIGPRFQTSHNWSGSDTFAPAGALPPQIPALNATKTVGSLACTRCHNVHGPYASATNSPPFLRALNDRDQMCLDCHRPRNTRDHTTGSHPVNFSYTSSSRVRLKTTEYRPLPVNANPANPTAAMRLVGGAVLCTTCHGVHYTDSNSATFDNHSGYYRLTPSRGYLLRTDLRGKDPSSLNICTNCHIKGNHNGPTKQQGVQCTDCHGGHVDTGDGSTPNVWLVRRFMNISTQYGAVRNRAVFFTSTSVRMYVSPDGTGVCQACHAVPPPGGVYPPEHGAVSGGACNGCHSHSGTSSFSGGSCTSCHGQPPQANVAGGPNGYAGNYGPATGVSEATTPHKRHAGGGSDYGYSCEVCHKGNTHNSGTFQDVFKSPQGTLAAAAGATPTYNGATRTCSGVYCHSDGAPRNASLAPVLATKTIPGWVNGAGKITGCSACHDARPATNAHSAHLAKGFGCAVCHAATVSADTVVADRSRHADGVKTVIFGAGTLAAGTTWSDAAAGCSTSRCHSSGTGGGTGAPVKSPVWTDPSTGACGSCHYTSPAIAATSPQVIGTNAHGTHLTGAYGPAPYLGTTVDACRTCHVYATSQPDASHVNGVVDVITGSGSPCAGCHPGTIPVWSSTARLDCTACHAATPSTLPNGVAAPFKGNFATTGHGHFGISGCTGCHDPNSAHIAGQLGVNMRINGPNDNTLCNGCHNGSYAPKESTHVLDKNATPTPSLCTSCHDPHGTTNLSMIRTTINGVTITFTNTSTGFVQRQAPYRGLCQVCHTLTNHFRAGDLTTINHNNNRNCLACHSHTGTYAFQPAANCDSCHGYPPAPAGFKASMGNWSSARAEDYPGGGGAHIIDRHVKKTAMPSEGWANCAVCHSNGSPSPSYHTMDMPVTPSKIVIDVVDSDKFNYTLPLGPQQYNGVLKDGANATGSCSNVKCHFRPSKKWRTP